MTFDFLDTFSKSTQTSDFMKIYPVRSELFHVGGQTDRLSLVTKLIVAFLSSADGPKRHEIFAKLNTLNGICGLLLPLDFKLVNYFEEKH